jgi:hypothetical protein
MDLGAARLSDFPQWLGTDFRVVDESGGAIALELVEAKSLPPRPGAPRPEPFSLIVRGPRGRSLGQGLHLLEHDRLGRLGATTGDRTTRRSSIECPSRRPPGNGRVGTANRHPAFASGGSQLSAPFIPPGATCKTHGSEISPSLPSTSPRRAGRSVTDNSCRSPRTRPSSPCSARPTEETDRRPLPCPTSGAGSRSTSARGQGCLLTRSARPTASRAWPCKRRRCRPTPIPTPRRRPPRAGGPHRPPGPCGLSRGPGTPSSRKGHPTRPWRPRRSASPAAASRMRTVGRPWRRTTSSPDRPYTPEGYVSGIFLRSARRWSGRRARVSSMKQKAS